MDLAKENYNIYQRLNSKNSSYTLKNHLKDYEKAQYLIIVHSTIMII